MIPSCAGVALTNSPGRQKVPLPEPVEFERLYGFGAATLPYRPRERGCPKKSQSRTDGQARLVAGTLCYGGGRCPAPRCKTPRRPYVDKIKPLFTATAAATGGRNGH